MEKTVKKSKTRTKQSSESTILIKAAKDASKKAIRTSKALGLDITFMKKGIIYKETAEGELKVVGKNKQSIPRKIILKKGSILNAKN